MADPRGCEYRQIKVMTATVWGNQDDGDGWNTNGTAIQTHGWLLPANTTPAISPTPTIPIPPRSEIRNPKSEIPPAQRFAVCWNGWVYPVLAVGAPASLDDDIRKQLQPLPANPSGSIFPGLFGYGAVPDSISLSYQIPLPVKALLLMRLGKPDAASAVWDACYKGTFFSTGQRPTELNVAYDSASEMWLFGLFNRAICAQMRADDDLALVSFRQLARIAPEVRKADAKLLTPFEARRRQFGGAPFSFLDQVPTYLADMERRHLEPPRKPALELGPAAFPSKTAWIKALIADLENVSAPQDGQPGWVELDKNPTVKALVEQGNDAVEPLLDCLEHDSRLTRSVHFWRDFAPNRTILATYEAAYTALTGIFKTTFFEIGSTGQDLTNSGPAVRAKVVADIRAYWEKRKGSSVEQQWFITLADDKENPDEWAAAAENIVKSGQSLRDKKNPTVSELLRKRIKSLQNADSSRAFRPMPAPRLADALLTWDGTNGADAVRGLCNNIAGTALAQQSEVARPLIALTRRLIRMGNREILTDYAGWLRRVPPGNISDGGEVWWHAMDWFQPLWENMDSDAMKKTASDIFSDKTSAWRQFIGKNAGRNEVFDFLQSPLIGVGSFRELLLDGLADQTVAGESGYLAGKFWMARFGFGESGAQIPGQLNPLDPLSKAAPGYATFRVCDVYARGLSGAQGMPALEFYWPEEMRDAVIRGDIRTLRRYGDRYRVTADNPTASDPRLFPGTFTAHAWFPSPAKPATEADVENGVAIFSLPADAQARLWPMPHQGASARWLAIKDFAHTEGRVDAFGKESIFPVYENQGRVWQAEEGLVGGKWQRFFGFVGAHCIARAPAAEIDFPAKWPWNELDNGFDCRLASDADRVKNPLSPGQPFLLTLELRNRRGIDQPAPDTLYNAATKALASGVELHLYRKTEPAPGELVPEAQDLRKRASNWAEVPPNGEPAHFNLVSSLHALAPTEAREVMSFNLADFYDLRAAGQYVVEIHFDLKSLKFTGGESNSRAFSIK